MQMDGPELARSSFPHATRHGPGRARAPGEDPGRARGRAMLVSVPLGCFAM
jgi:hypothetical protein